MTRSERIESLAALADRTPWSVELREILAFEVRHYEALLFDRLGVGCVSSGIGTLRRWRAVSCKCCRCPRPSAARAYGSWTRSLRSGLMALASLRQVTRHESSD